MKLIHKLSNEHCENMVPGSSTPHTDLFKEAWASRVSFETGFRVALALAAKYVRDEFDGNSFNELLEGIEKLGDEDVRKI